MKLKNKNHLSTILIVLFTISFSTIKGQVNEKSFTKSHINDKESQYYLPPFSPNKKDFITSPYTGITREDWIDSGIHILEGAFQYVDDIKTPMFLPKFPGKSYPHNGNENASQSIRSAAIFEAIARSFNLAAPILVNNPDLEINGIKVIDYYKYHLLELLTNPECDYYIGSPSDGPSQPTCELGNLSMWNLIAPDAFWNQLTKKEKDKVAEKTNEWAIAWTWPHNWRYFNVMMLTFLDYYGYETDSELMMSHIDNLILHYAGDGWYRDHGYDYYSIHVFHLYNTVWIDKYGKTNAPGRVKLIRKHQKEFFKTYPLIFSRKGEINMYGRSILYRLGASAAMSSIFLDDDISFISPGVARRVSSGALMQFITHPKFFNQGIPSLGFYGPFEPAIQSYSCSASPYWMFMGFTALTLPKNHPFWTEKEELGHWDNIEIDNVHSKYPPGMGMLISNHGTSGTSELRPGKIHNQDPNYCRLVYNTAFPWEADGENGITSSDLSVHLVNLNNKPQLPMHVDAAGFRNNVLYRQAAYKSNNLPQHIDMASIIIPGGEIRVERIRKISKSKYYLGHFSLPHIDGSPEIIKKTIDGKDCLIAKIKGRQLAVTNFMGWNKMDTQENTGLHPESNKSTLLYAEYADLESEYGTVDILISILLHKTDNSNWDDIDLQPIDKIETLQKGIPYHLGGMIIKLKNNKQFIIDFENMDGKSTRE
jgi:hypothetical protein